MHPLPSTLKAVTGSLTHSLCLYHFVLVLLNYVKWSRQCGCSAPDALPGTCCGYQTWRTPRVWSHPYKNSSSTTSMYPLWCCVWRCARVKSWGDHSLMHENVVKDVRKSSAACERGGQSQKSSIARFHGSTYRDAVNCDQTRLTTFKRHQPWSITVDDVQMSLMLVRTLLKSSNARFLKLTPAFKRRQRSSRWRSNAIDDLRWHSSACEGSNATLISDHWGAIAYTV